jgi:hypothetical protein
VELVTILVDLADVDRAEVVVKRLIGQDLK